MFYRNYKKLSLNLNLILILMVLGLVIWSGQAIAVVDCNNALDTAADADSDGLTDYQECNGITLADGIVIPGARTGVVPGGLNPDAKELFVILVPASSDSILSQITTDRNPLSFMSDLATAGGLGVNNHILLSDSRVACLIDPANDRCITEQPQVQKAVRVGESLDPIGNIIGIAQYGTPNGPDKAVVYTERIRSFVNGLCAGKTACKDYVSGLTGLELIKLYSQHTLNHEIGHTTSLTTAYDSRFGGNHYKSGTGFIMDQSVYYTDKGGRVTFYIPTDHTDLDRQGVKLK